MGGCNSFTPLTPVLLATGKKKQINQIKTGDKVLAADPHTQKMAAEPVTAVTITHTDRTYAVVKIKASDDEADITSTSYHLYWDDTEHAWIVAGTLRPGDHLFTLNHYTATVISVRRFQQHSVTYNLTIGALHTYFVLAGDTPVLVHNAPPKGCGLTSGPGVGYFASNTISKDPSVYRIDVENNAPGKAGGANIHIQFKKKGDTEKYYFNPGNGTWISDTGKVLSRRFVAKISPCWFLPKAFKLLGLPPP